MKKTILIVTTVIGFSFLFTGCSDKSENLTLKPELIGSPNIDYTEGYKEGCSTGYNDYVRNQKLYDFNADYRYGWNKGYSVCTKKALGGK